MTTRHRRRAGQIIAAMLVAVPLGFSSYVPLATAETVTDEYEDSATITYDDEVTGGATFRLEGSGWTAQSGDAGSQIIIKVRSIDDNNLLRDYSREGDDIQRHPTSGAPDATIWELVEADENGDFDVEFTLPEDLDAGQHLVVNVASGLQSWDTQRTLTTRPLVVDGQEWVDTREKIDCQTDARPNAFAEEFSEDGYLRVWGEGFCNEEPGGGGVKVTVKLDAGAISRLDDSLHSNQTIWAFVDSDPHDGTFDTKIALPDGTTEGELGSQPAFTDGYHSVQFLTGSLAQGDPVFTKAINFIHGEYIPSQPPAPVVHTTLTGDRGGGVTARKVGSTIEVTLPNAEEGDWVYASTYQDSNYRIPWQGEWFQADDNGKIYLPTEGKNFMAGDLKLLLQNGNYGTDDNDEPYMGQVLGWDTINIREDSRSGGNTTTPGQRGQQNNRTQPGTGGTTQNNQGSDIVQLAREIDNLNRAIEQFDNTLQEGDQSRQQNQTQQAGQQQGGRDNAQPQRIEEVIEITEVIGGGATGGGANTQRPVTNAAPARTSGGTSGGSNTNTNSSSGSNQTATQQAEQPMPEFTPDSTVDDGGDLDDSNVGAVEGTLDDQDFLTITLPESAPGDWVYVYGYTPDQVGYGWVQLDQNSSLGIDMSALGDGAHKFEILDSEGDFIGWTGAAFSSEEIVEVIDDPADNTIVAGVNTGEGGAVMTVADWLIILLAGSITAVMGIIIYARSARAKKEEELARMGAF